MRLSWEAWSSTIKLPPSRRSFWPARVGRFAHDSDFFHSVWLDDHVGDLVQVSTQLAGPARDSRGFWGAASCDAGHRDPTDPLQARNGVVPLPYLRDLQFHRSGPKSAFVGISGATVYVAGLHANVDRGADALRHSDDRTSLSRVGRNRMVGSGTAVDLAAS